MAIRWLCVLVCCAAAHAATVPRESGLLVSLLQGQADLNIRARRDACDDAYSQFDECRRGAHQRITEALRSEDDKPDFYARKACNYIQESVEECGDLISECFSEEDMIKNKDGQIAGIINSLKEQVENWDSEKCPAVKAYFDRQEAADGEGDDSEEEDNGEGGDGDEDEGEEDGEEDEGEYEEDNGDGEDEEDEDADEDDEDDEETDGSASLTASLGLMAVCLLLQ